MFVYKVQMMEGEFMRLRAMAKINPVSYTHLGSYGYAEHSMRW